MAKDNQLARMTLALVGQREKVSRTALNKLLFFADVVHLMEHGTPISKATYRKFDYGPVPDLIDATRRWMVTSGLLNEHLGMAGPYIQYMYEAAIPRKELDEVVDALKDSHREALRKVADAFGHMSATDLSDLSHRFEPWKSGDWYEPLSLDKACDDQDFRRYLQQRNLI